MVAEQVQDPMAAAHEPPGLLPQSDDENDIDDISDLRKLVKKLRQQLKNHNDTAEEDEDKHDRDKYEKESNASAKDRDDIARTLYHFDAKNVGKPTPWDGEKE